MTFGCPGCSKLFTVGEDAAGRTVRCKQSGVCLEDDSAR
jgi:hypothetical protein